VTHIAQECECSESGSEGPGCDEDGVCTCKDGYYGDKCMQCSEAHVVNEDGSCSGGCSVLATLSFLSGDCRTDHSVVSGCVVKIGMIFG
jgi:hypothetical protein